MQNNPIQDAQNALKTLHESTKTVILSTLNSAHELETSYSPYVLDEDGCYYFLASDLAPHSENIKNHPHIGCFLIEDESKSKNIYARARFSFKATAKIIERASEKFTTITEKLKQRTGKTVDFLITMKDFHLFQLTPRQGRLIIGFGQAFLIDGQTKEITHIDKDYLTQQN